MTTVYKDIEVEIDLGDFDTDDLVNELESRGVIHVSSVDLIRRVYEKRRLGKNYQQELDRLINEVLGRVV